MKITNNQTVEKNVGQNQKLKFLPPADHKTYKEILLSIGKVYAKSQLELDDYTDAVDEFFENEGPLALDILEKKRNKDPAYFFKQWAYLRFDRNVDNYCKSSGFGLITSPFKVRDQCIHAALLTYSFMKIHESLVDSTRARDFHFPVQVDPFQSSLILGGYREPGIERDSYVTYQAAQPHFTVITPRAMYFVKAYNHEEQITFPTLVKIYRHFQEEEKKLSGTHRLPLLQCQLRKEWYRVREAL